MFDGIFTPRLDAEGKLVIELSTELEGLDIYYTFEGAYPDRYYPKYVEPLYVPRNAENLGVITYRGDKPIGRYIKWEIKDLKAYAQQ